MNVKTRNESRATALERAHAALRQDLDRLGEAARSGSDSSVTELRLRLAEVRKHVAAHFRFEEHDGYMEAVRHREPHHAETIEELAADHRRLSASLRALVRAAAAASVADEALRRRVREWIAELRRHELRENTLVQETFTADISAVD